jgi:hypothetical protein
MRPGFVVKILSLLFLTILVCAKTSVAKDAYVRDLFSIGVELGNPAGRFTDEQDFCYGGSLRYESPLSDHFAFSITAGYLSFAGKSTTVSKTVVVKGPDTYLMPGQIGAKYYFFDQQVGFYLMANGGVHGYKAYETDSLGGISGSHPQIAFSYAPEMGLQYEHFDISVRYQFVNIPDHYISYVGFRAAFVF